MDDARPILADIKDEQLAVSRDAADHHGNAVAMDALAYADPIPDCDVDGGPFFQVIAPVDIREYTVLRELGEPDETYAERVALNDLILTAGGY